MKNLFNLILLIFFCLFPLFSYSQNQNLFDSLDLARNKMNESKYSESLAILNSLGKKHPQNIDIIRLKGQVLYWSGDFDATLGYFNTFLTQHPEADILKLDYGRILFELNHLDKAQHHLFAYYNLHPEDPETGIILATIAYWEGKPPKIALGYIERVLVLYPGNVPAFNLRKEILMTAGPQLHVFSSYSSDSQPLQAFLGSAAFSFYQSAFLQPSLEIQTRQFGKAQQALSLQIANKAVLTKSQTEFLMSTGFFKNSWIEELIPTWGFELRQKTFAQLMLSAGINRSPYLFTLASLNQNILPTTFTAGLGRETGESWTGKASVQLWQFQDNNTIRMGSAWFLIPVIKQPYFVMNIGYAFMMADSDENRFALVEPVTGAVNQTEIGQVFPGIFDPYFTPQNQMVHSVLAKLDFNFSQKVNVSLNNNLGVYAIIDNPNFIFYGVSDPQPDAQNPGPPVGTPSNPNAPGKPIVENPNPGTTAIRSSDLYRVLVPTTYFPLDLKGKITWKTNTKLTFRTEYAYLKTIFFDSHTLSLGLNYKFWNE